MKERERERKQKKTKETCTEKSKNLNFYDQGVADQADVGPVGCCGLKQFS